MKNSKRHIDHEELESYFNGKMNEFEKNLFEKRSQTDPFLADAIEGYREFPGGLNLVRQKIIRQKKINKSFFGSRTIAIIVVVSLVYSITWVINKYSRGNESEIALVSQTTDNPEVDVLPESIDTLIIVEESEQILISEIVDNKLQIEKNYSTEPFNDSIQSHSTEIIIEEKIEAINPTIIQPEKVTKEKTIYAPSIYIEDLYVVDYRELKRINSKIKYTKYVTSGLSANFENSESMNSTDLLEEEVEIPYMEYLRGSMEYFRIGRFKNALNRYLIILEQYPEDLNGYFYGAHCYYNLKKYEEALYFFEKCIEVEKASKFVAFREEANWYKAKTLLKMGRKIEAIELLNEIIISAQFYSKDAIQLIKTL